MYIYCVDDNLIQLKKAKTLAETACEKKNVSKYKIVECKDGAELLRCAKLNTPSMVLLDIHMPILDGLSTLVRLRNSDDKMVIIMVSSENADNVKRFSARERSDIDNEKKHELLEKVVERVRTGKDEKGKINSVLEACGNLGLDPVDIAKKLGANGYIQKPYDSEEASNTLLKHMTASFIINN